MLTSKSNPKAKRKGRLVLSRDINEEILIGNDIRITIVSVRGTRASVLIEAPTDLPIVRGEIAHQDAMDLVKAEQLATTN